MAKFVGFAVIVCLVAFSGSAAGWKYLPTPGNEETSPTDNCRDVYNYYIGCENFVTGISQYPPQECCSGLGYLNQIAKNEANGRSRVCQCIEDIAARGGHPPYSEDRIRDLYYKCNVHLSFPISEHMNCYR